MNHKLIFPHTLNTATLRELRATFPGLNITFVEATEPIKLGHLYTLKTYCDIYDIACDWSE